MQHTSATARFAALAALRRFSLRFHSPTIEVLHHCFNEARRLRDVKGVARSAHRSQAVANGPTMSQRECAGFNRPETRSVGITTQEPVGISPVIDGMKRYSTAIAMACVLRDESVLPAGL